MQRTLWTTWIAVAGLAACGGDPATPDAVVVPDAPVVDAGPDGAPDAMPVPRLADTGLCADPSCATINPGIEPYLPQFELWSDGATKRRWIQLPAGATIDTSDMDFWQYPEGTKLWKEFTRGGVRVETRLMEKLGPTPDDWAFMAYVWNATQDDAIAAPNGQFDANGTPHDVPSRNQCRQCHDRVVDRVLGFSAISLDHDAPAGVMDLQATIDAGWLSAPPAGSAPYFPLPGTTNTQAFLGYVHANCGHCHNPGSDIHMNRPLELRLEVARLGLPTDTPAYTTTIGVTGGPVDGVSTIVTAGDPTQSTLYIRFATASAAFRMPQLGTEDTDPVGLALITDWINGLD